MTLTEPTLMSTYWLRPFHWFAIGYAGSLYATFPPDLFSLGAKFPSSSFGSSTLVPQPAHFSNAAGRDEIAKGLLVLVRHQVRHPAIEQRGVD